MRPLSKVAPDWWDYTTLDREILGKVARLVYELKLDLRYAHFWAMDEWVLDGKEVPITHPLSFEKADRELCFDRIQATLRMPEENLHFPKVDLTDYIVSWNKARCVVMQGGQGDVKHWAFNDPFRREGPYKDNPPSPEEYRKLGSRIVDLHPITFMQNARTSGGSVVQSAASQALHVGSLETWKAEKVSTWQAGNNDSPFGMRLTTFMISKKV